MQQIHDEQTPCADKHSVIWLRALEKWTLALDCFVKLYFHVEKTLECLAFTDSLFDFRALHSTIYGCNIDGQ